MSTDTVQEKSIMEVSLIPFVDVPQVSARDKAYVNGDPALRPFYKYEVHLDNFAQVIADKQKDTVDRATLVKVLENQYQKFDTSALVLNNIKLLKDEKTFTVVTAHQPTLFTGPLYYIYKIISTVNLCKQLATRYSEYQFVPVFVTGGEDHDFEEMNHVNLFGKKLVWENEEKGSVGMMKTNTLQPILAELKEILGTSENANNIYQLLEKTHTQFETYSDATMAFANELFKDYGLVILNMNQADLKRLLLPVIKAELLEHPSKKLVDKTRADLEAAGFKSQAFPRAINLFYLREQMRERIEYEDGVYKILNTDLTFSEAEILAEAAQHPERFSPNVITRPLYQELILPNLAYVGGGGELAYWMERQSQFAHYNINFPMLIRRNSVMWLDKGNTKKLAKFGFTSASIFGNTDALIKTFVKNNSEAELSLEAEKNSLKELFDKVAEKAKKIDATIASKTNAEYTRQLKSLEQIENRLLRAEKQKNETALNQIRSVKEKLYPKNGLQERHDNFIAFYLKYGADFIPTLQKHLDPLAKGFVVIEDK